MATPEGKIKQRVNRLLEKYSGVYRFMPVQAGYGSSTLDYLLCVRGVFCAVETKKPGGKPTARQEEIIRQIQSAGGKVFVVANDEDFAPLKDFLEEQCAGRWEVIGHEPADPE